jgi:hypothetical protein
MKTIHYKFSVSFLSLFLWCVVGFGQEAKPEAKQSYLTVTTLHRNTSNLDLKREDWQKIEKEYFEKVTMKNPYVIHSNVLTHYFTADNTEILIVQAYESWELIDKAWEKSDELVKAAWPDEKARKAFFEK